MNNTLPKTAIIILAAGASKRMGSIKQLLPWKHTTLIGHAIEQALASIADEVFVVLGSNYKLVSKEIETYHITMLKNKNWSHGMGSSISCAIEFMVNRSKYFDAVLITLVDQPLIDMDYFNNLIKRAVRYNIVASKYKNRVGVPAIFSTEYFAALRKLNRDIGAKELLSEHIKDVKGIDAFDKTQDIDSISTYELLYQQYGKTTF